jgi:NAD(P)H-nitrite reductase large subunit
LENSNRIAYDKLLIAVGAEAVPLLIPGSNFDGVMKLDHMEDARRILKHARRGRTAVVIGGGITALELAEGLNARGVRVHYLLRGNRYWGNVLDGEESRIVEQSLVEDGIQVHFKSEATEILGNPGRVRGVRLTNGKTLACDLVAYAVGIRPRLSLAMEAGLTVDRGILVNESMQTSDADIFAAGDVAQVYDPFAQMYVLDSLWNPAREQGRTAGMTMAGNITSYRRTVPFNVTRLAGLTTTIIGSVGQGSDPDLVGIARGDSETWRQSTQSITVESHFDVNHLRLLVGKDRLLGAVVMGDQKLSYPLEKLIGESVDISPIQHKLLTKGAKVGDVIAEFWQNLNARN